MENPNYISVKEAAQRLGVSYRRAVQLIEQGRLPAQRFSRVFLVNETDLEKVTTYGKPGRPPKAEVKPESKPAKKAVKKAARKRRA